MSRFFLTRLSAGILALSFPILSIAQLQMVDGKSLRASQPVSVGSEISVVNRQQFHPFARSLPDESLSPEAAKAAVLKASNAGAINLGNTSIEEATIIIMQLVAEDAEADLKAQLAEMEAARKQRSEAREGNARMQEDKRRLATEARPGVTVPTAKASPVLQHESSTSQTTEAMSQRLQAHQDRRAKAMETLRKLLEASSSTESTVIGNIK